ncbi:MAG: protein kinase domain-containing protein [Armatimonadota bacterium]
MINRVIDGKYEIKERFSASPLFTYYRAGDLEHHQDVIVIAPCEEITRCSSGAMLKGLLQSVQDVGGTRVSQVLDVVDDDGEILAVTQHVRRGIDLKQFIPNTQLPPGTASEIGLWIAQGLESLHQAGVVHGYLCPQNVVMQPGEGVLKLVNFGIAPALRHDQTVGMKWYEHFAPYMAPEYFQPGDPTVAIDIYSFGCLLYQMLTGMVPYSADYAHDVALQHKSTPPPSPRNQNPGVPRALEGIVLKCLQKNPKDRYANSSQLVEDLRRVNLAIKSGGSLRWSPMDSSATADTAGQESTKSKPTIPKSHVPKKKKLTTTDSISLHNDQEEVDVYEERRGNDVLKTALVVLGTLLVLILAAFTGVFVYMTKGPGEAKVPALIRVRTDEAKKVVESLGLQFVVVQEAPSDDAPVDTVFKQEPLAGRTLKQGREVRVWVSSGSRDVRIPALVGLSQQEAVSKLQALGLKAELKNVGDLLNTDGGVVRWQRPQPGSIALRDSSVLLGLKEGDPVIPDVKADGTDGTSTDGSDGAANTPSPDSATKDVTLNVKVPASSNPTSMVRVEVTDDNGTSIPFEQECDSGKAQAVSLQFTGAAVIRVFINEELKKEVKM